MTSKRKRQDAPEIQGLLLTHELDLAAKDFNKVIFSPNLLGLKTCSVIIKGVQATGTSGDAVVKQGNDVNKSNHIAFATPITLTVVENGVVGEFDITCSAQYLSVDLSGLTLGSTGKLIVEIVAKHG